MASDFFSQYKAASQNYDAALAALPAYTPATQGKDGDMVRGYSYVKGLDPEGQPATAFTTELPKDTPYALVSNNYTTNGDTLDRVLTPHNAPTKAEALAITPEMTARFGFVNDPNANGGIRYVGREIDAAHPPTWDDAYQAFNQQARDTSKYSGIDRPWSADSGAAAAKQGIDTAYQSALSKYNSDFGNNVAVDPRVLGVNAQPNTWDTTRNTGPGALANMAQGAATLMSSPGMQLILAGVGGMGFAPLGAYTMPVAAGASKVAAGGSLMDGLKAGALNYAAGQLGSAVSGDVSAAQNYGTDIGSDQTAMLAAQDAGMPAANTTLGDITGKAASAAVSGRNPLSAAIAGGLGAGANELASQIPGFDSLPASVQNALISTAAANVGSAINATPESRQAGAVSPAQGAAANSPATQGALPSGTAPAAIAPPGGYQTVGKMGFDTPEGPLAQLYGTMLPTTPNTTPGAASVSYAAPMQQDSISAMENAAATPYYAAGGLVQHFAEGNQPTAPSATDSFASTMRTLGSLGTSAPMPKHDLRRAEGPGIQPYAPRVLPQLANLLKARGMAFADGGQPSDSDHPNYDGVPVFRTGGLEGLGGKYVEGKGDGTSDDITAMLANGEYVFSSDVVSALGNGSNKAGADRLGEMVKAIRERARSAPPDKLPPDAKSPLEYLKPTKGNKNG